MPVYDLNIDSHLGSGPTLTPTGAASVVEALSDASDASYAKSGSGGVQSALYTLANPSSPTGRLCAIGIAVRNKRPSSASASASILSISGTSYHSGVRLAYPIGTSIVDSEVLACQGQDPDSPFFPGAAPIADNLGLAFSDVAPLANRAPIYKALARLYYLPAVSCGAASAPTGTVTTTQRPVCTVPLSLLVESWQLPSGLPTFLTGGDVEFAVYHSADAPGAAPPAAPHPVWTDRVRFAETTVGTRTPNISAIPYVSLPNGTYVVFARASRDLMSGAQRNWSAWAKSAWTQVAVELTAPTLTPWHYEDDQYMGFNITCPATAGFDSATGMLELQRLVDDVWRDVRGLTNVAVEIGSADDLLVGYDYECERAATNTYRSRVSMVLTEDGLRYYSTWEQVTATGPALTGWNLKTVEDPAGNMIGAPVVVEPSEDSQAKVGLFEVLDRELPVAVSGTIGGMSGAFSLSIGGAAGIALLEGLRDYAGVVLLETAFGDVKYVRLTKVSWLRRGTAAAPRRFASITYAEVGNNLPESTT